MPTFNVKTETRAQFMKRMGRLVEEKLAVTIEEVA